MSKATPATYSFNKKPFTYKIMDVSTGHVSKADIDLLDKSQEDPETPIIVYSYREGYFIHVANEDTYMEKALKAYGFTDEFIHIYKRAVELKCYFVRLDADGIGYDDLPVFDWA